MKILKAAGLCLALAAAIWFIRWSGLCYLD
jgi:hypothetical protein